MKSALRQQQEKFAVAIAKLILWGDENDITVSFGDAFRDPRVFGEVGVVKPGAYGESRSCHKSRLALDLNTIDPADHVKLHDKWDTIGGSKRISSDMNHYSFEWQGMR